MSKLNDVFGTVGVKDIERVSDHVYKIRVEGRNWFVPQNERLETGEYLAMIRDGKRITELNKDSVKCGYMGLPGRIIGYLSDGTEAMKTGATMKVRPFDASPYFNDDSRYHSIHPLEDGTQDEAFIANLGVKHYILDSRGKMVREIDHDEMKKETEDD